MRWLHDDEREPDQGDGWATAVGVLSAVVFVPLRVAEVAIGIVLHVVVGVVQAPNMPGDLPGPVLRRLRHARRYHHDDQRDDVDTSRQRQRVSL